MGFSLGFPVNYTKKKAKAMGFYPFFEHDLLVWWVNSKRLQEGIYLLCLK